MYTEVKRNLNRLKRINTRTKGLWELPACILYKILLFQLTFDFLWNKLLYLVSCDLFWFYVCCQYRSKRAAVTLIHNGWVRDSFLLLFCTIALVTEKFSLGFPKGHCKISFLRYKLSDSFVCILLFNSGLQTN